MSFGKIDAQNRYEKWWLGKFCRPIKQTYPHKLVTEVRLIGPSSFVYGCVKLIFEDGTTEFVSCVTNKRGFKPTKGDVEIKPEAT